MANALTLTSTDGTPIQAVDEGRGPVILVVHPGLDDGTSWRNVAARLATRFRVVRIHRRQYRLDLAAGGPCTIGDEARDVIALARSLDGPVLLVGHSSGGVVALEALVEAPGPFAGAVLYEPPVHLRPGEWSDAVARAADAVAADRPGRAITIFLRDIVRAGWIAGLVGALIPRLARYRALVPCQIRDADAINRLGVRLDAYAGIAVPTVLLGGDRSPAHLLERLSALEAALPRAETVILRGQGHTAHQRAPDRVAAVVETLAGEVFPAR